jgi:trans-aconitate 2-methyltransferase
MAWDPRQYLRYADERLRPALDLIARIPLEAPKQVADLGCGPGNVTALLARRWPTATVVGVDSSPAMIETASTAETGCRFVLGDFATWIADTCVDVIYSNAALQWHANHRSLFPHLLDQLAQGGVFAASMPSMEESPLHRLQHVVAKSGPWATRLAGVEARWPILSPDDYYDLLGPRVASLDIWETTYLHVLHGEDAAAQWAAGTSLRPFLDRLPPDVRRDFQSAYAEALRPAYPARADGTTLLPFKRLFIIAYVG